jgi:flagellar export protein FliJ
MTIRPRAVRALRDARSRLRDIAAASANVANETRETSHLALVRENDKLEEYLDGAAGELASARTVHDLGRVAETTGVYRLEILDASARLDEASKAASAAQDRLRDSSRALRRAEKLEERVIDERVRGEARSEQRLNDDISCARRR